MSILPPSRPKMTLREIKALIAEKHPGYELPGFAVIGIRGYYKKTMGNPTANDRKLYDDAIFILHGDKLYSFNANTDPGAFRKGIASLQPGIWHAYKFDLHKGNYLALCQRSAVVTVKRDEKELDTGMFGINIHRGGYKVVSSEGCQTIHPDQWPEFMRRSKNAAYEMRGKDFADFTYTYILLEN